MPGEPGRDHGEIDVATLCENLSDASPVSVYLARFDRYLRACYQGCQVFFGLSAEGLRTFGCVDAREPDFVLLVVGVQDGYCVAVRDRNDLADDLAGRSWKPCQGEGCADEDVTKTVRAALLVVHEFACFHSLGSLKNPLLVPVAVCASASFSRARLTA